MADTIELVLDCRNELGEAPVWNDREKALYWVDCLASRLYALDPATMRRREWDLGAYPGSYAFRESQPGLLMAFRRGLALVELQEDGSIAATPIPDPIVDLGRGRFNDGACDRRGRFWVGQIDRKIDLKHPVGFLYRVDPDRSIRRMDGGFPTANGIAFSPDDRTIYYADSAPGRVYACDYDIATGINTNKRIFIDFGGAARPDGITVDVEGCLWVAEVSAQRIGRYRPNGQLDRHIAMPVPRPTSVAFGGNDLDLLYVTTMREQLSPEELGAHPQAGGLFVLSPGVRGLPEPRFAG